MTDHSPITCPHCQQTCEYFEQVNTPMGFSDVSIGDDGVAQFSGTTEYTHHDDMPEGGYRYTYGCCGLDVTDKALITRLNRDLLEFDGLPWHDEPEAPSIVCDSCGKEMFPNHAQFEQDMLAVSTPIWDHYMGRYIMEGGEGSELDECGWYCLHCNEKQGSGNWAALDKLVQGEGS